MHCSAADRTLKLNLQLCAYCHSGKRGYSPVAAWVCHASAFSEMDPFAYVMMRVSDLSSMSPANKKEVIRRSREAAETTMVGKNHHKDAMQ